MLTPGADGHPFMGLPFLNMKMYGVGHTLAIHFYRGIAIHLLGMPTFIEMYRGLSHTFVNFEKATRQMYG